MKYYKTDKLATRFDYINGAFIKENGKERAMEPKDVNLLKSIIDDGEIISYKV